MLKTINYCNSFDLNFFCHGMIKYYLKITSLILKPTVIYLFGIHSDSGEKIRRYDNRGPKQVKPLDNINLYKQKKNGMANYYACYIPTYMWVFQYFPINGTL